MNATAPVTLLAAAALALAGPADKAPPAPPADPDGDASSTIAHTAPNDAVQVAFTARSYPPGATATLNLRGHAGALRIQMYRAGGGHTGPMQGSPMGTARTVHPTTSSVALPIGDWPSGLYYAQVTTPGKGNWYAPFVLRPKKLGEHRVLVVLPTNTWQAYNYEDGDSWYEYPNVHTIDLTRPFVDGGVPPHYAGYDRGFMRWLTLHHETPDFLSDDDLDRIPSGDVLAKDYDLIVFPGHEEYVTGHEFDVVDRYRNLGGNLAFLSANDFFYGVIKKGNEMNGRWRWRDIGRPEAELVGAEYIDWNHAKYANKPFTITGIADAPWLFRTTGLADGDTFGKYGIEVDAKNFESPRGTRVLAQIHDIFGPGESAEMTYYTTPKGAKVFSAGVMNFGGSSLWPEVTTMMLNIWTELSRP